MTPKRICELYATGEWSYASLSIEARCSDSHINNIVHGRAYKGDVPVDLILKCIAISKAKGESKRKILNALTAKKIREFVRKDGRTWTHARLAKKFKTSSGSISNVLSGRSYKDSFTKEDREIYEWRQANKHIVHRPGGTSSGKRFLSKEQVMEIRKQSRSGLYDREIAESMGLSTAAVARVNSLRHYGQWATDEDRDHADRRKARNRGGRHGSRW